jgi:hypothetical protein
MLDRIRTYKTMKVLCFSLFLKNKESVKKRKKDTFL